MGVESGIVRVFRVNRQATPRRDNLKAAHARHLIQAHRSANTILSFGTVEKEHASIVTLMGAMTLTVAQDLHELLSGCVSRQKGLIICMSDVSHIDTAGAAILLEAYIACKRDGLVFTLVSVSTRVFNTLGMCRLNQVIPMVEDLHTAERFIRESVDN